MFKALTLQARHTLSDARREVLIRDRLSWMRFLGFDLGAPKPDENTIRHFRNLLAETGTRTRVVGRMPTRRIHHRKPAGRPMPRNVARANATNSSIRAAAGHVLAYRQNRHGLFTRTIGLARAEAKLRLANMA